MFLHCTGAPQKSKQAFAALLSNSLSTTDLTEASQKLQSFVGSLIPHIVMTLDVNLVEDPLRWLQEVLLHLHGNVPGQ